MRLDIFPVTSTSPTAPTSMPGETLGRGARKPRSRTCRRSRPRSRPSAPLGRRPAALGYRGAGTEPSLRASTSCARSWRGTSFYVFTINAFPYGPFHGTRVKEDVYQPDWLDAGAADLQRPGGRNPGRAAARRHDRLGVEPCPAPSRRSRRRVRTRRARWPTRWRGTPPTGARCSAAPGARSCSRSSPSRAAFSRRSRRRSRSSSDHLHADASAAIVAQRDRPFACARRARRSAPYRRLLRHLPRRGGVRGPGRRASRASRAPASASRKLQLSSALRSAGSRRRDRANACGIRRRRLLASGGGAARRRDHAPRRSRAGLRGAARRQGRRRMARALPRSGVPRGRRENSIRPSRPEGGARLHQGRLRRAASRGRDLYMGRAAGRSCGRRAAPTRSRARCAGCCRSSPDGRRRATRFARDPAAARPRVESADGVDQRAGRDRARRRRMAERAHRPRAGRDVAVLRRRHVPQRLFRPRDRRARAPGAVRFRPARFRRTRSRPRVSACSSRAWCCLPRPASSPP